MKFNESILLGFSFVIFTLSVQAQTADCDRACIDNFLNQYLDALAIQGLMQAP